MRFLFGVLATYPYLATLGMATEYQLRKNARMFSVLLVSGLLSSLSAVLLLATYGW